jgi:xanthine/uracil permease
MTGDDLDPYLGRAFLGDGVGTAIASLVGGSPTTTYAENIGVMAATRIYSTLAYYIAAVVAILFGFCPKFGAVVAATPGGVLGGITLVLYGMIGLLGAKIWVENRVDFANPVNLVPVAAGIIAGIGNLSIRFTNNFSITGIAAGTLIAIIAYHLMRLLAPAHLREEPQARGRAYEGGAMISTGNVETPEGERSPFADSNPETTRRG